MMPVHVCHVIHQLATGGLENGVVNLLNHTDPDKIRHSLICMTNATEFRERIRDKHIPLLEMHKAPQGNDRGAQLRVWRALRALKPDVVHTRNLTALDALLPACLAGVRVRIHGEHGRDMHDPDGKNKKILLLKKLHRPLIHHFTAVSHDLARGLHEDVGVPLHRITPICNGVDLSRFVRHVQTGETGQTLPTTRTALPRTTPAPELVFGTVGRLQDVKEQWLLIEALARLVAANEEARRLHLLIVGEGPMRPRLEHSIAAHGLQAQVTLAGEQKDIPHFLKQMDVFCLPSRAEGISNTVLEAMATGLPVLATRVGGNPELVVDGVTGVLFPHGDVAQLAQAMNTMWRDAALRQSYAEAAYQRAQQEFSLPTMVKRYSALYLELASRA
ncbi:MAG: hypothetical protein RLZZ502_1774 [Pseudomonadota bacterium]|jgi:sugar transferase (PEP-CTERM/EpsH1 system associated)